MSPSETLVLPLTPPSDGDAMDSTPAEKIEDEDAQAESLAVDDRPHGLRLMVIVAALLLSIFLVALDLVRRRLSITHQHHVC